VVQSGGAGAGRAARVATTDSPPSGDGAARTVPWCARTIDPDDGQPRPARADRGWALWVQPLKIPPSAAA